MSRLGCATTLVLTLLVVAGVPARAQAPPKILFLSKSSGYEHASIKWEAGLPPSVVDLVLQRIAREQGYAIETTKHATVINAAELAHYRVVIFYTTGDLTRAGERRHLLDGDGYPPMAASGLDELLAWIRQGGAFLGFHSATDTFHGAGDEVSPYIEMIGGEFRTHGQIFSGTVRVVDAEHPTMRAIPAEWTIEDEWYLFKNINAGAIRVLALLEPGEERKKQPLYDVAPYPVIWCRAYGEGRVYYNALGHREEVWQDVVFQRAVTDALRWALGEGELRAEPNYAAVVGGGKPVGEE